VAQLEEFLGATLFHRRPFALTAEGEKLYCYIEPFFSNLGKLAAELQGGQTRHIRIGASTLILRDYLPELLRGMRKGFPGLKVSCGTVIRRNWSSGWGRMTLTWPSR